MSGNRVALHDIFFCLVSLAFISGCSSRPGIQVIDSATAPNSSPDEYRQYDEQLRLLSEGQSE
ncbi:hypothetical protein Pla22_18080 [Rubripirellula amarantea]|uniref:Uncharacterized protein n=1 Tax=Rubripirellula amarantea TaxID=2527999 RepID=A0A5C5WW17_9BACT|nr:hypothetical protein Pla22_18080 [Rubripirellula amarantea]